MHRVATSLWLGAAVIVAVGLLSGCGSSRSILYSGVSGDLSGHKAVITDVAASHDGQAVRSQWLAEITHRARQDPSERFANLSAHQLQQRLAELATRYRFTVKRVQLLHPRQVAPLLIIQTRRYLAFAHATPAIEKSLDPHLGRDDRAGWAFEGFFLEAQDERGVPFLAVSNFMRGSDPGGGQWARSDQLYPFSHG